MIIHLKVVFRKGRNLLFKQDKDIWAGVEHVPSYLNLEKDDLQEDHFSRVLAELIDEKANESHIYRRDTRTENLLVLCKLAHGNSREALDIIEEILSCDKNNIVALVNKILILRANSSRPTAPLSALRQLNGLKKSPEWPILEQIAIAEVAYCNSRFTPYYYTKAIQQYESVLSHSVCTKVPTNTLLLWKYDYAVLCNRMLNKGNSYDKVEINFDEQFGKIRESLVCVIESQDEHFTGRAYVELADAFRKCETNKGCRSSMELPWNLTVDKCMENAYESSPDDTYVLERFGRYLRQMARKEEDFLHAISILEKASDKCPSARHVAIHQQALAWKSLWHIEEDMPEKRVFDNKLRTKFSKRKQKSKKKKVPTATLR